VSSAEPLPPNLTVAVGQLLSVLPAGYRCELVQAAMGDTLDNLVLRQTSPPALPVRHTLQPPHAVQPHANAVGMFSKPFCHQIDTWYYGVAGRGGSGGGQKRSWDGRILDTGPESLVRASLLASDMNQVEAQRMGTTLGRVVAIVNATAFYISPEIVQEALRHLQHLRAKWLEAANGAAVMPPPGAAVMPGPASTAVQPYRLADGVLLYLCRLVGPTLPRLLKWAPPTFEEVRRVRRAGIDRSKANRLRAGWAARTTRSLRSS